jgi:hypothetical protein
MNIFILDYDPVEAAKMLCDKHVVKMCLETAQILSTINGGPYKVTHAKHPCTLWASETLENYRWLVKHGIGISEEYTFRFGKIHKSEDVIRALEWPVLPLPDDKLTAFAQAMPEDLKSENAVESYRNYYMTKRSFCNCTKREIPQWFIERLANETPAISPVVPDGRTIRITARDLKVPTIHT